MTLASIFLVLALICFVCATFNLPSKVNFVALGLALWVLSILLGGVRVG